jgi:hypothetical protein
LTEHIGHEPGIHCHHEKPELDCTLCTYRAMEQSYEHAALELIKRETDDDGMHKDRVP